MLGGSGGPAGTVRSFVGALNSGNQEEAEAMVHPDSPQKGQLTGSQMGMLESMEVSVTSTEVLSKTETEATVEATISLGSGSASQESTSTWELRTHEGEWKIYSSG